jgi:hypothetical protein
MAQHERSALDDINSGTAKVGEDIRSGLAGALLEPELIIKGGSALAFLGGIASVVSGEVLQGGILVTASAGAYRAAAPIQRHVQSIVNQ